MDDNSKKSIEINILGQSIRIKHENEEYIRHLEKYVNEKVENIQAQQDVTSLQLAVRVLLVIVDEYFNVVKEKEGVEKKVDDRAKKMIRFIDSKATQLS